MACSTVLILGDSFVERSFSPDAGGWASLLQFKLRGIADIKNRGLPNMTSGQYLKVLPQLLQGTDPYKTSCIILLIGSEDDLKGDQNFRAARENMVNIIKFLLFQGFKGNKIVFGLTPSFYGISHGDDVNTNSQHASTMTAAIRELNVTVVNIHEAISSDPLKYLNHEKEELTPAGGLLVFKLIWPEVTNRMASHSKFMSEVGIVTLKVEMFRSNPITRLLKDFEG